MSSIPISLRDQLIEQLREIEQKTESIFMVLAESLPSLVTEMKESLNQSQSALACMDQSSDEGCRDGIELSAVVGAIRSEMERGAARFQAMSERDTQLFGRLQNGITQLEEIAEAIDAIREDSEDMELVSLNAMTVALKAGNAGRAFSYITEELKRLANRTITLSESISERGTRLIENFRELERTLNDAREFQESLVGNLQSRIAGGLDEL